MKETFITKNFRGNTLAIISQANEIIEEYNQDNLELTLRQLYYQFVSRDLIPNTDAMYHKLSVIISDARLAGLTDWDAIVDRTRYVRENPHWSDPGSIIRSAAYGYAIDKWEGQDYRCEIWIEKDALIGVIEEPCNQQDVPFFSCRGYTSQSEMYTAAKRLQRHIENGYEVVVFHLGDHDPSGVDMSRDIQTRLELLSGYAGIKVKRIALTMEQIKTYNPPPNPAKLSDTRCKDYIDKYGSESWELDALEPRVMRKLITDNILKLKDEDIWNERVELQEKQREQLNDVADNWKED